MNLELKQQIIDITEQKVPFQRFLGMKVLTLEQEFIRVHIPFKPEFVGDFRQNRWHGGVLASIMDSLGGAVALANFSSFKDRLSTIDLRIDYLRSAEGKELIVEAKIVRMGNRILVSKMKTFQDDVLIAEGKGVYSYIKAED